MATVSVTELPIYVIVFLVGRVNIVILSLLPLRLLVKLLPTKLKDVLLVFPLLPPFG